MILKTFDKLLQVADSPAVVLLTDSLDTEILSSTVVHW